jgi:soluble lytic murein transglycosylase-like protein
MIRTVPLRLVRPVLAGLVLVLALASTPAGAQTAAGQPAGIPHVLGDADVARYKRIFALQEEARWKEADREIERLRDRLLLGHVLFQRYMHPCCYRSSYKELSAWLSRYADHPGADRVYELALKRRPSKAARPRRPTITTITSTSGIDDLSEEPARDDGDVRHSKSARRMRVQIARSLSQGKPATAEDVLEHKNAESILGVVGYDNAKARVAEAYFREGEDEKALELADAVVARSSAYLPYAHWTAGLAAWRLGRYGEAADHFEALAQADSVSGWNRASGAYWAARARLVNREPDKVNRWLDAAAQNARSFYGMLARRALGLDTDFTPVDEQAGNARLELEARFDTLLEAAPGARAVALVQIGQNQIAEAELRPLYNGGDTGLAMAMLELAKAGNMPGLALRIGNTLSRQGHRLDEALFPIPGWEPPEGYLVDRALLFAVMRQESAFNSMAHSSAGARGLMQMMPRTASEIARDRALRGRKRDQLYDPEFNISLGQRYLRQMLDSDLVQGNIFFALVAYNAGPGNLARWLRTVDFRNDPLLYIETVPARETRIYIERVIANYWAYRARLGQPAPSLVAVASGRWPFYNAQETATVTMNSRAKNGKN